MFMFANVNISIMVYFYYGLDVKHFYTIFIHCLIVKALYLNGHILYNFNIVLYYFI